MAAISTLPREVILLIVHAGGHELIFTCHEYAPADHSERLDIMISYGISVTINSTTVQWTLNDKLHRHCDLPAYESVFGGRRWYKNGHLRRGGDLPCVITSYGDQFWRPRGQFHREGGPAIIYNNGNIAYYKNDQLHRDSVDGHAMPAVIHTNGDKFYYFEGKRHRTDGPAGEYADGRKRWFINDVEVDPFCAVA